MRLQTASDVSHATAPQAAGNRRPFI